MAIGHGTLAAAERWQQQRGRALWYEVQKRGRVESDTQWFPLSEIETCFKPCALPTRSIIPEALSRATC